MYMRLVSLIVVLFFSPIILTAQSVPADRFVWLCGLWEQQVPDARVGEHFYEEWDIVNDSTLMGKCYSSYQKYEGYIPDTTITENLILSIEGGQVYYTATVYGQNDDQPVTFNMTTDADNNFTFENPKHDFPKKIVYQHATDDGLTAVVSADDREQSLPYKKIESYYGGLKQYYFVMLTKGATTDQDAETAAQIQADHLANIQKWQEAGKIQIAGPFVKDGDWKGIFIFNSNSQTEVEEILKTDPAIQAGRLAYTIMPWATTKGAKLD